MHKVPDKFIGHKVARRTECYHNEFVSPLTWISLFPFFLFFCLVVYLRISTKRLLSFDSKKNEIVSPGEKVALQKRMLKVFGIGALVTTLIAIVDVINAFQILDEFGGSLASVSSVQKRKALAEPLMMIFLSVPLYSTWLFFLWRDYVNSKRAVS